MQGGLISDPNLVHGTDVSHHNGVLDFKSMKQRGLYFCSVKATQRADYRDPRNQFNVSHARDAGLIVGNYHFFEAATNAIAQVNWFLKVAGKPLKGDLLPMFDWEWQKEVVRPAVEKQHAQEFLDELTQRLGYRPFIYSAPGYLERFGDLSYFHDYPLWLAEYGVGQPKTTCGWAQWTLWQYTDDNGIDLDLYNGSPADFEKYRVA